MSTPQGKKYQLVSNLLAHKVYTASLNIELAQFQLNQPTNVKQVGSPKWKDKLTCCESDSSVKTLNRLFWDWGPDKINLEAEELFFLAEKTQFPA